ncbi:MAG: hypothetical protein WC655_27525 [Candidatus Hydrogenedentales bacterium]|jgi:hypothetical protein
MKSLVWTLAFVVGYAAWASPPPPPGPGPIGWEKRIAKGFDPPIEYVIVYGTEWIGPDVQMNDLVAKWGPGAVEVLAAMYRDPEWKEFRYGILNAIMLFDVKESKDFLVARYEEVRSRPNPTPQDKGELSSFLLRIRTHDPKRADQLVDEGLKDKSSPHFDTFVYDLSNRFVTSGDVALKAKLDGVLQALPEESQLRQAVNYSLEASKARQRASEPMDEILSKEKGDKP